VLIERRPTKTTAMVDATQTNVCFCAYELFVPVFLSPELSVVPTNVLVT